MMLFTSGWFGSPTTTTAYPFRLNVLACSWAFVTKGQVASTIVTPFASQRRPVGAGHAVGPDDRLPAGDVVDRPDDAHALLLQALHRLRVMDDGAQRLDRGLVPAPFPTLPGRLVGDGDGAFHAEAEAGALGDQHFLRHRGTPGTRRSISATTSSTVRVVVSMYAASWATLRGEFSRVLSCTSRRRTSRRISSYGWEAGGEISR